MRLRRNRATQPTADLTTTEKVKLTGSPRALWTDSLGRLAIRCAQALLALIIASAVRPFIRWMERRRVPRALATWIALLTGLIIFGGIVMLVVAGVRSEWDTLVDAVSSGIGTVNGYLASGALPIDPAQLDDLRVTVIDFVTSAEFGSGAIAGVGNVVEVVAGLVLTVVLLFYFLKDGPEIWRFLIKPFRPELHARAERVGHRAVGVLGGYVSGTAVVAAVDAILIGAALWILQVPLALPLAMIVFVGAFIPIVGATVAEWPSVEVANR